VPGRYVGLCVERLTENLSATEIISLACELARAAARRGAQTGPSIGYQDLALKALRSARKKGFKDAARLMKDKDLSVLRERKEFQAILAELQRLSSR
jgi:hypothetical protein